MRRAGFRNAGETQTPFCRRNQVLLALASAVILSGYVLLATPPVDGFLSLTLAPLLLIFGYCVLVPVAILAWGNRPTERK